MQFGNLVEDTSLQVVRLSKSIAVSGTGLTLKKGDVVALHAVPGCRDNECSECTRNLPQICEQGHHSGIGQDGFYASYAIIDVKGLVAVPPGA